MVINQNKRTMERIDDQRYFKIKEELITPYNAWCKGDYATSTYWGSKFGKTSSEFEKDFDIGNLDIWFEEYFKD